MDKPTLPYGLVLPSYQWDWGMLGIIGLIVLFCFTTLVYVIYRTYRHVPLEHHRQQALHDINAIIDGVGDCLSSSHCYEIWKVIRRLVANYTSDKALLLSHNKFIALCLERLNPDVAQPLAYQLSLLSQSLYQADVSVSSDELFNVINEWVLAETEFWSKHC